VLRTRRVLAGEDKSACAQSPATIALQVGLRAGDRCGISVIA
jgi:hypothetical protein